MSDTAPTLNPNDVDPGSPTDVVTPLQPPVAMTSVSPPKVWSIGDARAAIFNAKPQTQALTFAGVPIIIQEPAFGEVIDSQQNEDRKVGMAMLIVKYVYLADGQKLFSEEDVDSIIALPWNEDLRTLNNAISKFLGVAPSNDDKSQPA